MAVEEPMEYVADWEGEVEDGEEPLADLGAHTHAEWWVEPDHLASTGPPPACPLILRLEDQLLLVAGSLERLLVDSFGGVEDLLGGGEGRQPLVDLGHGVLGDMAGVVGVDVQILHRGA